MVRTIPVVVQGSEAGSFPTQYAGTQKLLEYVEEENQRYGMQPTMDESTHLAWTKSRCFYSR